MKGKFPIFFSYQLVPSLLINLLILYESDEMVHPIPEECAQSMMMISGEVGMIPHLGVMLVMMVEIVMESARRIIYESGLIISAWYGL